MTSVDTLFQYSLPFSQRHPSTRKKQINDCITSSSSDIPTWYHQPSDYRSFFYNKKNGEGYAVRDPFFKNSSRSLSEGLSFRSLQDRTPKRVIIKSLRGLLESGETTISRFMSEHADAIRHLVSRSIIQVVINEQSSPIPYLVTTRYREGDLHRFTDHTKKSLTNGQLLVLMRGIVESVDYLHQHGIVHRNVSGHNFLVDDQLRPKLHDFKRAMHLSEIGKKELQHVVSRTIDPIHQNLLWEDDRKTDPDREKKNDAWGASMTALGVYLTVRDNSTLFIETLSADGDDTEEVLKEYMKKSYQGYLSGKQTHYEEDISKIKDGCQEAFWSCLHFDPGKRTSMVKIINYLRFAEKYLEENGIADDIATNLPDVS